MRPFTYQRADTSSAAVAAFGQVRGADALASPVQYIAGGTTLVDLMKLDVMRPEKLIDINALDHTSLGQIEAGHNGLKLGAMARMADAAEHPMVKRDYPVIAQSLQLAASQQL
ncbi:MAG: FAD binding domain-containing protein, partial [Xanthobacteraceae bacterium]